MVIFLKAQRKTELYAEFATLFASNVIKDPCTDPARDLYSEDGQRICSTYSRFAIVVMGCTVSYFSPLP